MDLIPTNDLYPILKQKNTLHTHPTQTGKPNIRNAPFSETNRKTLRPAKNIGWRSLK